MNRYFNFKIFLLLIISSVANSAEYSSQASNPNVNNEKPEKGSQAKRIHPHALKLILNGKKEEAISYLKSTTDKKVNPEQTQMLIDLALDKPNAWKFDAKTWPWKRTLGRHIAKERRSYKQVHHRLRRGSGLCATTRANVGHHQGNRPAGTSLAWRQRLHR